MANVLDKVTDFLFGGTTPPSVKTYGTTTTTTPAWYNDYTQALIGKANAIASEPYQAYDGSRIAGFTDNQNLAFALTPDAAASYLPYVNDASNIYDKLGNTSALSKAQPYINNSAQNSFANVQNYMNPYMDSVTNRIGQMAQRNLSENIIPTIQNQFIGGGSFGGSRSGTAMGKAMRDISADTLAQQTSSLASGYNQAMAQSQADLTRQGQLGQITGAISQADLTRQLQLGQNVGALGALAQSLGLNEAAALEAVGLTQQNQNQRNLDLAYKNFADQRDYPRDQISFLNNAIRGLAIPTTSSSTGVAPASAVGPSGLSQLAQAGALIYGIGKK
jgi:hypothetical protein